MTDVLTWLVSIIGVSSANYEFMYLLTACILIVICSTCALSLFIGIAFAIFKR